MSGPKSCPKCYGIMEENDTSLVMEESGWDTKAAVKVLAYSCRSCGFIEFWKA